MKSLTQVALPLEIKLYSTCIAFVISRKLSNANQKKQHDAIVAILKSSIHWQNFIEIVDIHPLVPQIFEALQQFETLVPENVLKQLEQRVKSIRYKNLMHVQELKRLMEAFQNAGIEVMPYKGVVLAEALYGDVGKRYTNDIDIVITKANYTAAKEVLLSEGYEGGFDGEHKLSSIDEHYILQNRHHIAFKHHQKLWYVELHWQWFPGRIDFRFDESAIRPRLVNTQSFGDINHKAFQPKDLFLSLNIHAAEHYCMSFKWLYDSVAFLQRYPEIPIEELCNHAARHNARGIVLRNLYLLHYLYEVSIPQALLEEVENSRKHRKAIKNILHQFSSWPMTFFNEWRKINYGLRLADGTNIAYKLNYLRHVVFLEDQGSYHLPRLLHPLYPLIRPFRIVNKMISRKV